MKTKALYLFSCRKLTIALLVFVISGALWATVEVFGPTPYSRALSQSEHLIDNQILSTDGLIELWADVAFGGLPPLPGTQPYDHPVGLYAVDWYRGGFEKSFLNSLVGVWEHGVPVYSLLVYQDQKTRNIIIENVDGQIIYSTSCPYEYPYCTAQEYALSLDSQLYEKSEQVARSFIEHNDPARYGIRIDLVPVDQVFDLLYTRAQNQNLLQALAAQSLISPINPGGGGGAMMMSMSGGSGESQISAINLLTNGIQIEMTSSFSSVTAFDLFASDNLPPKDWSLVETDILITNGQVATRMISTQDVFKTFALGQANDHADGDGVRDSFEFFLYDTSLEDLNVGLVSHWTFDEIAGVDIEDCVSTNNGILAGTTASAGKLGRIGRAMIFGGTNDPDQDIDALLVEDDATLDIETNITITAWINPSESDSEQRGLVYKREAYILAIEDDNLRFRGYGLSDGGYHTASQTIPTGTWSHVAATYDGGSIKLYIDGELVLTETPVTGLLDTSTRDLGIAYRDGSAKSEFFAGMMDDVRLYNIALSSNQIYGLYEVGDDIDEDGLSLANESQALTDHTKADTDGDGLSDKDELTIYLTNPIESNEFASILGTVTYKGSSTGQVVVLASPTRFGWDTNNSTTLSSPGPYTISNVPVRSNYWIKAFRDLNTNGVWEANEPPHFYFTNNIAFSASGATNIYVHIEKLRGMRVDPGEYNGVGWSNWTSVQVSNLIVSNALEWGVNTLYVRPLSYFYGTYWDNPTNQYLFPTGNHGANDFINLLIPRAHSNDLKVIAWMQPLNAFTNAWMNNPSWRYKKLNGDDWDPDEFWLSPFNTNVLNGLDGVVDEVLDLGFDGMDIAETFYDRFSTNPSDIPTYDVAATNMYFDLFPNGTLGDDDWFRLRDQVLTSNIYERYGRTLVSAGKEYHVTQTWDAKSDGVLQPDDVLAKNTGVRFGEIMDLPEDARPDYVIPELIWQREAASSFDFDFDVFNPEWTIEVVQEYVNFVRARVLASIHPEITKKTLTTNTFPSLIQFENSMLYSITNAAGCDFFIHDLALENNYLPNGTNANSFGYVAISNVYWGTP